MLSWKRIRHRPRKSHLSIQTFFQFSAKSTKGVSRVCNVPSALWCLPRSASWHALNLQPSMIPHSKLHLRLGGLLQHPRRTLKAAQFCPMEICGTLLSPVAPTPSVESTSPCCLWSPCIAVHRRAGVEDMAPHLFVSSLQRWETNHSSPSNLSIRDVISIRSTVFQHFVVCGFCLFVCCALFLMPSVLCTIKSNKIKKETMCTNPGFSIPLLLAVVPDVVPQQSPGCWF